jgi:hypothetical protein
LFLERNDTGLLLFNNLVEILKRVGTAFGDAFTGAAFAFGGRQTARTGNRANPRSFEDPFFLSWNIHPPPYNPPLATFFKMASLSSAAGH